MSDAVLERRCRRLVRAYPDARRAEEVLTTLMESNEGRRAPRAADAFDVLWHALVTRLGNRAPGTRFGAWGDALSVAVVTLAVTHAAVAVAIALRFRAYPESPAVRLSPWDHMFRSFDDAYAAVVFAVLAVYAAGAIAFGAVRLARVAAVLAAGAGAAAVVVVAANGHPVTAVEYPVTASIVAFWLVAVAVVSTTVVARAARVAPRWWWGMSAMVTFGIALRAIDVAGAPFEWPWPGAVPGFAIPYAAVGVALLAAPLARAYPQVFCGTALAVVPALPFVAYVVNWSFTFGAAAYRVNVVAGSVGAAVVLVGVVLLALPARHRYDAEAPAPDEPA